MYIKYILNIKVIFGLLKVNNYNLINYRTQLNMVKKNALNQNLVKIYSPKTENQKKYIDLLNNNNDCVISAIGPAGTGKTFLACISAINNLKENKIDKIVITRPVFSVDEDIGFLPGNIDKKMEPWTRPIFDVFLEFYSKSEINNLLSNNKIEISPLGFMRGRTFINSIIIADEMQNSTPNQMLMLLTRIGNNSKIIINGDLNQSDRIEKNGLNDLVNKLKNNKTILSENNLFYLLEFNNNDIQRSKVVKGVLDLYNIEKINKTNETLNKTNDTLNKTNDIVNKINIFNETLNKPNDTLNKKNDTLNKTNEVNEIVNKNKTINGNSDAALIPLKDISKHYNTRF
jgi:phosphate starvation-inducible PhoH-like protein